MIGDITKKTPTSSYQPSQEVIEATSIVRNDMAYGIDVLHKGYSEFNGYSVIERMNMDQRTFQSFVDESVEDPSEAWKWRGTRSLARKKAFAMHAHMTSSYVVPSVYPQHSGQKEDRDMAEAMRDIVEWETVNSNYRSAFLLTTMGMLVNPVTYLQADYREVSQTILEKTEQGYSQIEILDEILSGLNCNVMSADQVLITNAYEQDIQKQKAITKRRYVDHAELGAKYRNHPNWDYLSPGVKSVYNDEDGLFYDVMDSDHPTLVEEATWESRRGDSEVVYLNGIYFGNENVDWNPIKHRDNRDAPKYDIVPFGYHRVNEHFFYFASLMFEVGWDDQLIDAMWGVEMNRGLLETEDPVMFSGVDKKVDTAVIFPGGVMSTQNPDARVQSILPPRRSSLFPAIQEVEDSMSEASLAETEMGALPAASQTATAVKKTAQSARILLLGVMKTLGQSVSDFGGLLVDIALQHLTTAELDEITGGLKYREFTLENQKVNGKKVSKKIRFDQALMGRSMSDKAKRKYMAKLLTESGYPDTKEVIYVLNPHLFSKMKYLVRIEPDDMMPKNREFERLVSERLYTLLRTDPLIEPEILVRELVQSFKPQGADRMIKKQSVADIISGQANIPAPAGLPGIPAETVKV